MLSVGQPGRVPLIETSDIQSNIWRTTFPGMSWSRSQYRVIHCLVAKLLYSVFIRIAAICYYLLNWNAWNALAIITAQNKRCMSDSVLIAHNTLGRLVLANTEHDLGIVNRRFGHQCENIVGSLHDYFSFSVFMHKIPNWIAPTVLRHFRMICRVTAKRETWLCREQAIWFHPLK